MQELRTEIAAVVKLIATEYVAKYPTPAVVPPPMSLGTPLPFPYPLLHPHTATLLYQYTLLTHRIH